MNDTKNIALISPENAFNIGLFCILFLWNSSRTHASEIIVKGLSLNKPTAGLFLNTPIATKVVCFSRLLECLRSLYDKQCGPRSDCSYRSSLFWVHAVCFYTLFLSNVRQLIAADDFCKRHFQMHFFPGALRVRTLLCMRSCCCYFSSKSK